MKYVPVGDSKSRPLKNIYGFKKRCSKCDKEKTLKSFYRRGGTGVLQSRCIKCTKEAAVESRGRVTAARCKLFGGRLIEI